MYRSLRSGYFSTKRLVTLVSLVNKLPNLDTIYLNATLTTSIRGPLPLPIIAVPDDRSTKEPFEFVRLQTFHRTVVIITFSDSLVGTKSFIVILKNGGWKRFKTALAGSKSTHLTLSKSRGSRKNRRDAKNAKSATLFPALSQHFGRVFRYCNVRARKSVESFLWV